MGQAEGPEMMDEPDLLKQQGTLEFFRCDYESVDNLNLPYGHLKTNITATVSKSEGS